MTSTSGPSPICPDRDARRAIEDTYRAEWGRLLSVLVSRTRRLDLAEDALSEAFARASGRWTTNGVPANPAGWLYTTATRVIASRIRAEAIAGRKAPMLAVTPGWETQVTADVLDSLSDDRLELILLCCHPALPAASRSALALRLVVGTSTEEIARLFLVPTATMAARITRAKKKIVGAGIPLVRPVQVELRDRLDGVCQSIYLAFTAGYAPGAGPDLLRADLAGEAVRLAAVLARLVPGAPQAIALLALVTLQHARRDARLRDGRLVTLPDQDRSVWHVDELRAGLGLVDSLPATEGYAEELRLQALIAAEHARATTAEATNWVTIAARYAELEALTGSPVVRLNRAVAVAEADGPEAGLALLAGLDKLLPTNHRLHGVRAELEGRAGDTVLARHSFERALDLCENQIERHYLVERMNSKVSEPE